MDASRRRVLAWLATTSSTAIVGCGGATPEAASDLVPTLATTADGNAVVESTPVPSAPAPAPTVMVAASPTPEAPYSPPAPDGSISGPTWTPARDASGNVLPADVASLDAFVWYAVSGTEAVLDSVIERPHYPKPRGAGDDGSSGIVAAWGGAAWDFASQTMYISGGGHGDTHECDTAIYALKAQSLKFQRVVDRQPLSQFQWFDVANSKPGAPVFGDDPAYGGAAMNSPLKNGVPTSMHTYDGLVWIPPDVMQGVLKKSNTRGGIFYPGNCRAIVNLDDQTYSPSHFIPGPDFSYQIAMIDGSVVFGPRASFNIYRFDLGQREVTDWPGGTTLSQGKFLPGATSSTEFTYNHKCFAWLRERREAVSFAGNQRAVRIRYGAAMDSGASDWTPFHDAITLTSANGSDHLDFSATNLQDIGTNLLCAAGAHYDHVAGCIWVQANTRGGSLYQVTGISGSTWTVRKRAGSGAIAAAGNGTFGRFRVATIGTTKLAIRVTSTTQPIQVMRLT